MDIPKPSPTESLVHQMLSSLVKREVITEDLRHQILHDAAKASGCRFGEPSAAIAPDLGAAIDRLKAFRSACTEGAAIDGKSGLTAGDIDTILSFFGDFTLSD